MGHQGGHLQNPAAPLQQVQGQGHLQAEAARRTGEQLQQFAAQDPLTGERLAGHPAGGAVDGPGRQPFYQAEAAPAASRGEAGHGHLRPALHERRQQFFQFRSRIPQIGVQQGQVGSAGKGGPAQHRLPLSTVAGQP